MKHGLRTNGREGNKSKKIHRETHKYTVKGADSHEKISTAATKRHHQ